MNTIRESQWDFFIAHAAADASQAEELYGLLEPKSRVFLDTKSLLPGDEWDRELPNAQRRSLITVVLISDRTEEAYYSREEIAAAIRMARRDGEGHRVVPVYLDGKSPGDDDIPYGLRLKQGIRVSPEYGLRGVSGQLLSLLNRLRHPSHDGGVEVSAPTTEPSAGAPRITPALMLIVLAAAVVVAFTVARFQKTPNFSGRIEQVELMPGPGGGSRVFVRLSIHNTGTPSVVQKLMLRVTHATSRSIDYKSGPTEMRQEFSIAPQGRPVLVVRSQDDLQVKTKQAIGKAKSAEGWLLFEMPDAGPDFLRQSGTKYVISFADVTGKNYTADFETR